MATQSSEPKASTPAAAEPSKGLSGRDLWDEVRISPVEIAMPGGVGITLRAYRLASELTPTEVEDEEEDPFDARERASRARLAEEADEVIVDDEFAALVAEGDADPDQKDSAGETADEPDPADFVDERTPKPTRRTRRHTRLPQSPGQADHFQSPESLVSFITFRVLRTISPSWTAGRPWRTGYSRPTSTPYRTTATSWTSWWRTCAAGTTRGTCHCSSTPARFGGDLGYGAPAQAGDPGTGARFAARRPGRRPAVRRERRHGRVLRTPSTP